MDRSEALWVTAYRGCLSEGSPALLPPTLGTREEVGLVGAEAAKAFLNRKTRRPGPQEEPGIPELPGPRVTVEQQAARRNVSWPMARQGVGGGQAGAWLS